MRPTSKELAELVRWAMGIAHVLVKLSEQDRRKDDVLGAALRGLNDALRNSDWANQKAFKAYARVRIIGEVLDVLGEEKRRAAWELLLDDAERGAPEQAAAEAHVLHHGTGESYVDGEAEILSREAQRRLREAVLRLVPADQRLLKLRGIDGLPWEEVAATAGIPESTARDHYRKLRDHLRAVLLDVDPPHGPLSPRVVPLSAAPQRRG